MNVYQKLQSKLMQNIVMMTEHETARRISSETRCWSSHTEINSLRCYARSLKAFA